VTTPEGTLRVKRPEGSSGSSDVGSLPGEMLPLLLALLLSPTGEAGKITGGHEAKPHSHPYMAFLEYHVSEKSFICGGLLVREDFVLTAAHCCGSSINVTLRDHNIYQQERTQQVIPYDPFSCPRELRRKAYLTAAVSPIRLPWRRELVKPGMVCSVAGWGHLGVNNPVAEKLQEVELEVQRDEECISRYKDYNTTTQICAGNPRKRKGSFLVRSPVLSMQSPGHSQAVRGPQQRPSTLGRHGGPHLKKVRLSPSSLCPQGASGGPLVCNGMAQGIVSFGEENGTPPNVYTRPFLSEEIIGGHEAKPHSRPYMVFVQSLDKESWKRCSGVLVQKDFVLTAAHCRGSLINVTLGAHNIKKQERTQQVIPVRRAIPHPDYNPKNYSNDIMLLQARKPPTPPALLGTDHHWLSWTLASSHQLERKAKRTAAVRPLSLPRGKARVKPGKACSVAGWGQVAVGTPTTTLQEAELTVQEDPVCKSLFPGYYSQATQICVGDPRKVKAAFKGDSGGPLVCKKVVQGIFSYGKLNGKSPGVFTKVSHFLSWIKRAMKRL
ncbi:hypothetical protein E2I00_006782, partial [Balaenoptera physalus]